MATQNDIAPLAALTRTERLFPPVTATRLRGLHQTRFRDVLVETANGTEDTAPSMAYLVQKGEVLSGIVLNRLRAQGQTPANGTLYEMVDKVARANRLDNPDMILPGQKLDLSVLDQPSHAPHAAMASTLSGAEAPRPVLVPKTKVPECVTLPVTGPAGGAGSPTGSTRHHAILRTLESVRLVLDQVGGAKAMETRNVEKPAGPWVAVVASSARLTSGYGTRRDPITRQPEFHTGIDLAAPYGSKVTALEPGLVVFSGWKGGYGKTVIVQHANGRESLYGHNSRTLVSPGDRVDGDTPIALVGSTGRSTGPHVHFEVRENGRPVNPIHYLQRDRVQLAQAR